MVNGRHKTHILQNDLGFELRLNFAYLIKKQVYGQHTHTHFDFDVFFFLHAIQNHLIPHSTFSTNANHSIYKRDTLKHTPKYLSKEFHFPEICRPHAATCKSFMDNLLFEYVRWNYKIGGLYVVLGDSPPSLLFFSLHIDTDT